MRLARLDHVRAHPGCVVTVGSFDGVHVGHQEVVGYLVQRATAAGVPGIVVTFDPHPREVVRGERVPLLSTIEERAGDLAALGVRETVVIPFTPEFAATPAPEFVRDVLVGRLQMGEIVIGYNHGFGRKREGNADLLRRLGPEHGFRVDVIPAQVVEKHAVSSTQIRRLLLETGDVATARHLLGRPYRLAGRVVQGDQRGRLIGFPTANLDVDPRKVVPLRGVYAVRALVGEESWPGMMNIGLRPTFEGESLRLEVHVLGFSGDLYGAQVEVEFIERLRDEQRFDGIDALRKQLEDDASRCQTILSTVA